MPGPATPDQEEIAVNATKKTCQVHNTELAKYNYANLKRESHQSCKVLSVREHKMDYMILFLLISLFTLTGKYLHDIWQDYCQCVDEYVSYL